MLLLIWCWLSCINFSNTEWLLAGDGRVIVIILAVFLVLPLCSLRRMRSVNVRFVHIVDPAVDAVCLHTCDMRCRLPCKFVLLTLQLEAASYGGLMVVISIIAVVVHSCFAASFPAIHSGEFPVWSMNVRCSTRFQVARRVFFNLSTAWTSDFFPDILSASLQWTPDLPEAFAVLGYGFYLHPVSLFFVLMLSRCGIIS